VGDERVGVVGLDQVRGAGECGIDVAVLADGELRRLLE
jgi:hypothetical protein